MKGFVKKNLNKPSFEKKEHSLRTSVKYLRYLIQWGVLAIVLYGGFRLYLFFGYLKAGNVPLFEKPLSVEGFMPIGALMALKLWITEGVFDPVHPAALVIFIGALLLALFLRKSFCGWVCPVGTVSELVWKAGRRISGKNFSLPWFVDYPLRSVKYLLMGFFLYVILLKMSPQSIRAFLYTPYWKVADLKLMFFFIEMSGTTAIVLLVLACLSLFFKNFWCRYLCPYGALLGLLSYISPSRIIRDNEKCIHCGNCTRACPSLLKVGRLQSVNSPECIGCLSCVSACPSKGALDVSIFARWRMSPYVFAGLVVLLFFGTIALAQITDHWKAGVTIAEYQRILPHLESLRHP